MDRDQVREKIVEAAQAVKSRLIAQGIPAKAKLKNYKYMDDVEQNLRRLFLYFDFLDPRAGSSVFEIGPGNCYLLFMCRELRGCRVAGVDMKPVAAKGQGQLAFRFFREHFGLEDVIRRQVVEGLKPIAFGGRYDAIVATRAHFNRGWGEEAYRFWLRDCYQHLEPEGKLMVHFRRIEPEILEILPVLQPHYALKETKKLSILSRETIGQVLGEQP